MRLFSTNNPSTDLSNTVSLKEAVLKSLPADNGLYMPVEIPQLSIEFWEHLSQYSFSELSFEVLKTILQDAVAENELRRMVNDAINFPAPLVQLADDTFILELFHGKTLAFKDFGARFMSRLMSYFVEDSNEKLTILVATSGDTGSAVAHGFYDVPNIDVIILYPEGRVSELQELQMTTLGKNITALKVKGSFDDCQRLVKQAFLDVELNRKLQLTSANSINIARLLPQMLYYFEAYKQLKFKYKMDNKFCFVVPSGNFGNLTAGLFARKMGLPVELFIAATNINDTVPEYLTSGVYSPKKSLRTISNAMDVGKPSNFARMISLCSTWNNLKSVVLPAVIDDEATKYQIRNTFKNNGCLMCPHTAVGSKAWKTIKEDVLNEYIGVILATAHPAKFIDVVEEATGSTVVLPDALDSLKDLDSLNIPIADEFSSFKQFLLDR